MGLHLRSGVEAGDNVSVVEEVDVTLGYPGKMYVYGPIAVCGSVRWCA